MGYFDQYDQYRPLFERLAKAFAKTAIVAALIYGVYWLFFRNWREERRVERFLETVQAEQYRQAYALWGCTAANPCAFYPYEEFLEDWGPESPLGGVRSYDVGRSWTQPNGVIIEVEINGQKQPNLWVQKDTKAMSFFPY